MDVTVDTIGAQGDGIAHTPAGRLYIPFAAPGDRLRVAPGAPRGDGRAAAIEAILAPGPGRIEPVCRHFGDCGGCALQHLAPPAIADVKRALLQAALARRGLRELPVDATVGVPPGTRRRVRFAFRRGMRGILGFNRRESRLVLNVTECPVVRPEIAALLGPLRALCLALPMLGDGADVQATLLDTGLDLLIVPDRAAEPDLAARERLAAFADAQDLCRLSWQTGDEAEPISVRRTPAIRFAGVSVLPPAAAFLQPSIEGERAVVAAVLDAFRESRPARIADLYAGCGALTFPLAAVAPVEAMEGDAAMVAALRGAIGDRTIAVAQRDLARDPPAPAELQRFDAVVFDPPRTGARPVAEALAGSTVATVVAVSCNPATLARDLRILVDGGYRIERITPIDQFPWSAHVEAVAVLRR
jgi:23S rRNA (uracil1939-C5)-methyltransferase